MLSQSFRRCINIKSRSHPDICCKSVATHGDFCARHYKRPVRYTNIGEKRLQYPTDTLEEKRLQSEQIETSSAEHSAVKKIQKYVRAAFKRKAFWRQGPSANDLQLSENKTDLYSLESLENIPRLYLWSYIEFSHIWTFDIRTFSYSILNNPYTRLPLPEGAKCSLEARLNWLKEKGYSTFFIPDYEISTEQAFSLRVLDVFMKFDFLGYHSNSDWFMDLDVAQQITLYKELFDLWNYRLALTEALQEQICPGLVIKKQHKKTHRELRWWRKKNIEIMEALVSRSSDKSNRILGAMYCLKALCKPSRAAAEAYEWLV